MAQNIAIESLVKERQKVILAKQEANKIFDEQISDLETAIDRLSGKKVWEVENELTYDDENADYIRGSIEN